MSKRGNGEGSIRKRSDNRWEGRYYDKTERRQKSVYGQTQLEAIKNLQYIQLLQGNQSFIENNDILLEAWSRVWLENYTSHLKPLTISSYRGIVKNHIIPALGDIHLKQLTTEMIQHFYNQKIKVVSAKTVSNIHGCLHKCLQQAVMLSNHYLEKNPADGCSVPLVDDYEFEPLEDEDIQTLLQATNRDELYDQIILVGLFTGMRQSEILGLRWRDVDLDEGTAYIKRQLQKDKVVHEEYNSKFFIGKSPKSKRNRLIDLPPFVVDILKIRRRQQKENKENNRENWQGDLELNKGLIFTHPDGGHLSHQTVLKKYKKLLAKCNLTESRFHDLRHSYAVIALSMGENLKTLQLNMGHCSEAFMLKKYGHATKAMRRNSASLMQGYISNQINVERQGNCLLGSN